MAVEPGEEGAQQGPPEPCMWCGGPVAITELRCPRCDVVVPAGDFERDVILMMKKFGPDRLRMSEIKTAYLLNLPPLRNYVERGQVGQTRYNGHVWLPRHLVGRNFILIVQDEPQGPDEVAVRGAAGEE